MDGDTTPEKLCRWGCQARSPAQGRWAVCPAGVPSPEEAPGGSQAPGRSDAVPSARWGAPPRARRPSPSKKRCSASVSSTTSMAAARRALRRPRYSPARGRGIPARLPLRSRRPLPARPPSRAALARPPPAPRAPPAARCAPCRPARAAAPGGTRGSPGGGRGVLPGGWGRRGALASRGLEGDLRACGGALGSPWPGLRRSLPRRPRPPLGQGVGIAGSESGFQNQTSGTPSIASRDPARRPSRPCSVRVRGEETAAQWP